MNIPVKNIVLFLICWVTISIGHGQVDGVKQDDVWMEDNIFLDGVVTDYFTGESISGVNITAVVDGKTVASGTSDGKGEYKLVLEYDKEYTISFSKPGLTGKKIVMNTHGVPDLKRQKVPDMMAEITLFQPNDCIKTDILNRPIGRAQYFPKKNVMDWDMDYSMPLISSLNKMLDDCAEKIAEQKRLEEQKEKEYASIMKNAGKALTKEEYEEAITQYKKAIAIFPERPEPQSKLKLIETELAKKAEAEKQRAEEKARAEAEAIAKAEAAAAAKKVEEEKLAKLKAQAEALAKAQAEAMEKAKAEAAAKKAEEERLAKEKAKAEAKAKKEAELKAQLRKEAEAKKLAEEQAKKEEATALAKMKEEQKAKELAQEEAKKRAEAEAEALKEQLLAQKKEKEERIAKEAAAQLAIKAEKDRAINAQILLEVKAEVKLEIAQQEQEEKQNAVLTTTQQEKLKTDKGSSSIKIKNKNKSRHLYQKPNKHRKGKGPTVKKRMVF